MDSGKGPNEPDRPEWHRGIAPAQVRRNLQTPRRGANVARGPDGEDRCLLYTPFDEIFRSTDGGRTWTALLGQAQWDHAPAPYTKTMNHHWLADLEIDPFDSDHAIFPTGYGIDVYKRQGASISC